MKAAAEKSAKHKAEAVEQSKKDHPPEDVRLGKVNEELLDKDLSLAKVQVIVHIQN